MIDNILLGKNDSATITELKSAWGLPNVTYNDDFANVVATGIMGWQGKNWDPATNDPSLDQYCGNITANSTLYPETERLRSAAQDLLTKGGYGDEVDSLTIPMLNWIGWLTDNKVSTCESSQDTCFGTHNATYYAQDDISRTWRAWPYQVNSLALAS